MKTFKDNDGREWTVGASFGAFERIKDCLSVNLGDRKTVAETIDRLAHDDLFVVQVAYEMVKPQCEKRNIERETFGEAMSGDAIAGAADAILEAIVDFFRSPELRRVISQLAEKVFSAARTMLEVAKTSLNAPTDSPASPESTPSV